MNRFESAFQPSNQFFEFLGHRWLSFNSQILEGVKEEVSKLLFKTNWRDINFPNHFNFLFDLLFQRLQNYTVDHIREHGEFHLSTYDTEAYLPLIMLDHIPFHKPAGFCVDSPHILYDSTGEYIAHQNMISENMTNWLISFKPVIIFNGHDHNGCYYLHQREDFAAHEYVFF